MHSSKDAYAAMAGHFSLSEEDQKEMLPSGKQATCKNRIAWARVYLTKALLLESPKRGLFRITERGQEVLKSKPADLRVKHLKQYPEFVDFHSLLAKSKDLKLQSAYFEQLIDGLVYELYFPDEIKAAGKELLPHLGELTPIADQMTAEEKLAVIQAEFDRLYDPSHPVRNRLETLDSVEVVRTIREALKR